MLLLFSIIGLVVGWFIYKNRMFGKSYFIVSIGIVFLFTIVGLMLTLSYGTCYSGG